METTKQEQSKCIYLDYNATTPFAPEVVAAMRPILEGACFGNPSSAHRYGREAHAALERARAQVAALLECDPDEVVLTSGGTESNNTALTCCQPAHIVTSAVEHPAVRAVCAALAAGPLHTVIHVVPVDSSGLVDPAAVARELAAIRAAEAQAGCTAPSTVLVSVMHANNEVGAVQPIAAIAAAAHAHGALVHTDAAQSAGKIDVRVHRLGVDLLSLAGHKLYGPKGVGALYVRRGADALRGRTLLHGAGHEHGRRPGTENVLGATGLGAACALARAHLAAHAAHTAAVRNALLHALVANGMTPDRMRVNGPLGQEQGKQEEEEKPFDVCETQMLPNTLSVSFRGISAPQLLAAVGDRVAASAGAACHSGGADAASAVSDTLRAMGVPLEWALGTVRLSVGRETTFADVREAARCIADAVNSLQAKEHTA